MRPSDRLARGMWPAFGRFLKPKRPFLQRKGLRSGGGRASPSSTSQARGEAHFREILRIVHHKSCPNLLFAVENFQGDSEYDERDQMTTLRIGLASFCAGILTAVSVPAMGQIT